MAMPRRIPWRPLAALAFLGAVVYLSRRPDVQALLDYAVFEAKLEAWRPFVETAWGVPALLGVSAFSVVVSFPQIVVIVAAGLLFSAPLAFAATWAGCNLGALACYALARQLGNDPLFQRLQAKWAKRFPAGRQTAGLMFWLRLTMFMASPANWIPGLTGMPLRNYLIGNLFGTIPWVIGVLLVTQKIRVARSLDASVLLQWELAVLLAISALVAVVTKRVLARREGAAR